jgi:RNA polymerase sigma-70 factor, ECF subfamily
MMIGPEDFTLLLIAWKNGDQEAGERLFTSIYQDLRRLAQSYLQQEPHGHTLQATALVHELYLRLFQGEKIHYQNRAHFFVIVSRQLRRLLVDHARAKRSLKRTQDEVTVDPQNLIAGKKTDELLILDQALSRLAETNERAAKVVELRYFGGLTEQETADVLNISVPTVKRDWNAARAWLFGQIYYQPE